MKGLHMVSVRDAFFNRIYEMVARDEDIYVVTADLGAPSLDDFRRDYPERYISVGIAEQNLVSFAAGMALAGKKVVAYGLNPFPVTRAFDQIRSLMAELKIPFTLCLLNAGLCSAECGYTHMPIEDTAMIRTLSNIRILNPTDENMSYILAEETSDLRYPRLIRFDKALVGKFYEPSEISMEKGYLVRGAKEAAKVGIVTNGFYARELMGLIEEYKYKDQIKVFDLFSIPVDRESLVPQLCCCENLLTVEENIRSGGLGSMILELLSDHGVMQKVVRMGLDLSAGYYDVFTDRNYIRKLQNIDNESIMRIVNSFFEGEIYQ